MLCGFVGLMLLQWEGVKYLVLYIIGGCGFSACCCRNGKEQLSIAIHDLWFCRPGDSIPGRGQISSVVQALWLCGPGAVGTGRGQISSVEHAPWLCRPVAVGTGMGQISGVVHNMWLLFFGLLLMEQVRF